MQGWKRIISTEDKILYLQSLLGVGFHTIDFGSFVSPNAIPQMADTPEVLQSLDLAKTRSKLLAIVANERGAEDALKFNSINYLGFPFSISETFQQRNTNASREVAFERIKHIQQLCEAEVRQLVIYLSMGFGNPYGDAFDAEIVYAWAGKMRDIGVEIIALSDTVGIADPATIGSITNHVIQLLPEAEIGVHLHSTANGWRQKFDAAYTAGCRRFDGALKGIGGCPMAGNELVGNMDTLNLVQAAGEKGIDLAINEAALNVSLEKAAQIFAS